ncbi:hypothetical protein LCGC14_2158760, partial [marine sediment metagenome]
HKQGGGNYQTHINEALREYIQIKDRSKLDYETARF